MKRRNFLAAFAATTLGAWLLGRPETLAPDAAPIPAPRDGLAGVEEALNRTLGPLHHVRIQLRREVDRAGILGTVQSTMSLHRGRFRCGLFKHRHLPPDQITRMVARQIKYQATKCAESVAFTRRTGHVMRVVDREGHRLHHRIYWQHETTGRIRWSQPA